MKIRKQMYWRWYSPVLKKRLSFEQRFKGLMKSSFKIAMLGAAYCFSRMTDLERAQFLASLSQPLPFLPPRI